MLDEADRLLNMDFEQEIDQILKVNDPSNPVRSCGNLGATIGTITMVATCRGPCKTLHSDVHDIRHRAIYLGLRARRVAVCTDHPAAEPQAWQESLAGIWSPYACIYKDSR